MTPLEFLERKLAGMLEALIHRHGFRAPFFGVAISANGSLLGIAMMRRRVVWSYRSRPSRSTSRSTRFTFRLRSSSWSRGAAN